MNDLDRDGEGREDPLESALDRALDPRSLWPDSATARTVAAARDVARTSAGVRPRRGLLLGLAASLVAGVFLGREWAARSPRVPPIPVAETPAAGNGSAMDAIALVASATGAVEVAGPGDAAFRSAGPGESLGAGFRVRTTATALALVELAQGTSVRLAPGTELVVLAARSLELLAGRVLASVSGAHEPLEVKCGPDRVRADASRMDVQRHAHGDDGPRTEVRVLGGRATLGDQEIERGFLCRSEGGIVGRPERMDRLAELDRWVDELLRVEGRDSEELTLRVDEILAQLGRTKMEHLYDAEIRALAPGCVRPLVHYVRAEEEDTGRRRQAAVLVGDLATAEHVDELLSLLHHTDPVVRREAARALVRVTGTDLGIAPEAWEGEDTTAARARWTEWRRRAQ